MTEEINYQSTVRLAEISKRQKVKRFIYASSSSVYGIKEETNVHEDMILDPLTDYSKFKAECEKILIQYILNILKVMILRLKRYFRQKFMGIFSNSMIH